MQAGDEDNSLRNTQGFERLYADLRRGEVPNYSFIVPNQCHDQHARGASEVGPYCQDTNDNLVVQAGDVTVQNLVGAIKASEAWKDGHNAIVVVWDENDYSSLPNQVVTIVDTNYGVTGVTSKVKYNHFSLLKTLEAGFGLAYLNHAADDNVPSELAHRTRRHHSLPDVRLGGAGRPSARKLTPAMTGDERASRR